MISSMTWKAMKMTTELSAYYYNLGLSHALERRISDAVTPLKKSVCYQPTNRSAWNLLGLCYYKIGRFTMARYCWTQCLKNGLGGLDPDGQPDGRQIGTKRISSGRDGRQAGRNSGPQDASAAMHYLNQLEKEEKEYIPCLEKSVELAEKGNYPASLRYLKEDRISELPSPQLITYTGILEYLSGNRKKAIVAWQTAAELDKSDAGPVCYLEAIDRNPFLVFGSRMTALKRKSAAGYPYLSAWFIGQIFHPIQKAFKESWNKPLGKQIKRSVSIFGRKTRK